MEEEFVRRTPGFIERAQNSGPIGMAGLVIVVLAVVMMGSAPYLLERRRYLIIGFAGCVGVAGFALADLRHVKLNLAMRDAEAVRRDCAQLIQSTAATRANNYGYAEFRGANIPASMARLGAMYVCVTDRGVRISLIPEDGLTGGERGFLYNPKQVDAEERAILEIRETWYPDFYEYVKRGD